MFEQESLVEEAARRLWHSVGGVTDGRFLVQVTITLLYDR